MKTFDEKYGEERKISDSVVNHILWQVIHYFMGFSDDKKAVIGVKRVGSSGNATFLFEKLDGVFWVKLDPKSTISFYLNQPSC